MFVKVDLNVKRPLLLFSFNRNYNLSIILLILFNIKFHGIPFSSSQVSYMQTNANRHIFATCYAILSQNRVCMVLSA
jgi:hypothetical protein